MRIAIAWVVFAILSLLLVGSSLTPSAHAASAVATVQFYNIGGGLTSLTNEKTHNDAYSAKLEIPSGAPQGSGCLALYPYNNTLNSLDSFQVFTSYTDAVPRFIILLDLDKSGKVDDALISDYQFTSDGNWQETQGGNRWGWSETNLNLGSYGQNWSSLNYWKTKYGNATILFVGVALEYWAVNGTGGLDQPLYADEVIINGVTYNVVPASNLTPLNPPTPPIANANETERVQFNTLGNGQASMTNECLHTSPYSARLEIPINAGQGSFAMALYPYNQSLKTLDSFSVWTSFTTAVPRFVVAIDCNNDGIPDLFLMSDYQFTSNGAWQTSTGGNRWGWTVANTLLTSYGTTWNSLDYWKILYGNQTALYVGICLEYWAVYDNGGCGQPLYADELILNGIAYNITGPPPSSSPTPTSTPISSPSPAQTPAPTQTPSPTPSLSKSSPPATTSPTTLTNVPSATPQPLQIPTPTPPVTIQPAATPQPIDNPPLRMLAVQPDHTDESSVVYWASFGTVLITAMIAVLLLLQVFKRKE